MTQYGAIKRNKNTDEMGSKDIILTSNYAIPYRGVNNLNTIVISSVGTGKTRGFLKSNLLQKGCSFVVTDTKGDLLTEFYYYLQSASGDSQEYVVKVVDLKDPLHSNHYNPFYYMHSEEDVVNFALALSVNVTKNPADSFWLSASTNLIASMCFFLFETHEKEERNLKNLLGIFNDYLLKMPEDRKQHKNAYGELIDLLPATSLAKKFFLKVQCNERTWESIVVTVGQALSVFEYSKLQSLTSFDDIDLAQVGKQKMALFINLDDTNPAYDFIAGLIYTQLFRVLYQQADNALECRLEQHVRFFMDDFANYKIPDISHILSTCRSRGISLEMLLQSESQLKALYGDEAENIIANCAYVYMGSNDIQTQQNIAARLGKTLKEIQNSTETTYVFFPEGTTIVDKKADYTKHNLYRLLCVQPTLHRNVVQQKSYKLGDSEWKEALGITMNMGQLLMARHELEENKLEFQMRKSIYDSEEEELFHNNLRYALRQQNRSYECFVHVDLREIFDINNSSLRKGTLKYKLMLMHCDFIIKRNGVIVCGIEIDGEQHVEPKQAENDKIKNEIFAAVDIPLLRVSARAVREDCMSEVKKIIDMLSSSCDEQEETRPSADEISDVKLIPNPILIDKSKRMNDYFDFF